MQYNSDSEAYFDWIKSSPTQHQWISHLQNLFTTTRKQWRTLSDYHRTRNKLLTYGLKALWHLVLCYKQEFITSSCSGYNLHCRPNCKMLQWSDQLGQRNKIPYFLGNGTKLTLILNSMQFLHRKRWCSVLTMMTILAWVCFFLFLVFGFCDCCFHFFGEIFLIVICLFFKFHLSLSINRACTDVFSICFSVFQILFCSGDSFLLISVVPIICGVIHPCFLTSSSISIACVDTSGLWLWLP